LPAGGDCPPAARVASWDSSSTTAAQSYVLAVVIDCLRRLAYLDLGFDDARRWHCRFEKSAGRSEAGRTGADDEVDTGSAG
jgi:hypothetical protein